LKPTPAVPWIAACAFQLRPSPARALFIAVTASRYVAIAASTSADPFAGVGDRPVRMASMSDSATAQPAHEQRNTDEAQAPNEERACSAC